MRCSSTLFLTLALDGGWWSRPCPGQFTPGKETWYSMYRRLGGPQGWSVQAWKISPLPGFIVWTINPLNPELNPICHLLALLGVHHFLHISRIRVKSLTLRLLMSYIYMEHPFLMFLDHTRRRTTVGRTPLDE